MHPFPVLLASLFAVLPHVAAHGYLKSVAIDGKTYMGNVPNQAAADSPIRQINDVDPVKGASNPNLSCGQSAQNAALVVPANPGSTVAFAWASGNGGNWPHNTGPMLTYMASCGSTTCDKFDASGAQWFKVDQAGKKSDGSTWVQQDIMNGQTYSMTLPDNIVPGDYLIRHEIIALQLAVSMGGAEFYPSCTQVRVSGNGNGAPNATVSFPGAYSDSDPGIFDPNVYNPGSSYTFPGPAIASFVTDNGNGASTNPSPSASAPVSASASASASASGSASPSASPSVSPISPSSAYAAPTATSPSSGSCPSMDKRSEYRPRRFSRVMRDLNQD
ncbi:Endoglucanase-7 [Trametes pubescens]|uniref:lytic cellulose monooxygenase (C4-dehydrogenating) n=1 Tax=Trametes pubescens TaxID=154538 RepID=A0A1M2VTA7_TRAPU|nr:Endoglucanase-7 [Trametes pubescens]